MKGFSAISHLLQDEAPAYRVCGLPLLRRHPGLTARSTVIDMDPTMTDSKDLPGLYPQPVFLGIARPCSHLRPPCFCGSGVCGRLPLGWIVQRACLHTDRDGCSPSIVFLRYPTDLRQDSLEVLLVSHFGSLFSVFCSSLAYHGLPFVLDVRSLGIRSVGLNNVQ
jgi:hypothetical protein